MFDGILCGDHQKRLRQWEGLAVDSDLRFVHGFEKSGLRARSGAIDFVGQDDVGKNWAGAKFKFARLGIVDADAENITGKQVRGELDALKAAMKGFCESLSESRFADAGNVFDEQVTARKQSDQRELDGLFFAVDGARDGALKLRDDLGGGSRHWLKTRVLPVTNSWRFKASRPRKTGDELSWVERSPHTGEVKGSSPLSPTIPSQSPTTGRERAAVVHSLS